MLQAVMGFRLDGKMQMPEFQFDCEEVRYSHRFQPFTNVSTPPYIPYVQYKVSMKTVSNGNFFMMICSTFLQRKKMEVEFELVYCFFGAQELVVKISFEKLTLFIVLE